MTAPEKTYLDTSPFIYLLEKHPTYALKVQKFVENALFNEVEFTTSVVTLAEFGVRPEKIGRRDSIEDFHDLVNDLPIEFIQLNSKAAVFAYTLRAKYQNLKSLDALQLGAELAAGCQFFLTNDFGLKKITEIQVILVDEL